MSKEGEPQMVFGMTEDEADLRRGDIQCPFVTPNGDEGVLCCTFKIGHDGEHLDVYRFRHDHWWKRG